MLGGAGYLTSINRHVAILAAPTAGHLNPLQVLGAEMRRHGCRVTIVHVEGARRFVVEPGIDFAPLPDTGDGQGSLDAFLDRLARPTGPVGTGRMIRATAALSERLLREAPSVLERIGADAVIADAVEPAGPLIAERLGLPCIASVTGLPLLSERDVPPPFLGWRYRPDALGRFRNRGGYAVSDWLMRPVARVLDEQRRRWRLPDRPRAPLLQVAQCPKGLDYPRIELPPGFRYGSRWRRAETDEPTLLPDDGRPLVFCSLGTLQGARWGLFAKMARACALLGARAVIAHGGALTAAEEAALPGDPLVRAFWPQEAVLRRCSAAVLHGGFNTVLDALAAGVPIVAVPIAFEQPATAARLAWVGAGRVLPPRMLSVAGLRDALDAVMRRPSYRRAARRIGTEMEAAGGVAGAADAILATLGLDHHPAMAMAGTASARPPSTSTA